MESNVETAEKKRNRPTNQERLVRAQLHELQALVEWCRWKFDGEPLVRVVKP